MKQLNIGLFGFGCVGQGLYETINTSKNFNGYISKICIKNIDKERQIPTNYFTTEASVIIEDDTIDIIVELIDDPEKAFEIVKASLLKGKSVVTANKKMVAEHLPELLHLQEETGKAVLYEGAVCGSIPIIRTLEEYFGHEPIDVIKGIFNGSTNYILTKIFQEKNDYETALVNAQALGFAESDPTVDVQGFDPKYKLSILILHTFGIYINPNDIVNLGIDKIGSFELEFAERHGYTIKFVAHAQKIDNQIYAYVIPQYVCQNEALSNVHNEFNAVELKGEFCDEQIFTGKGAGSLPTGVAVLSDISALSYDYRYEYKKQSDKVNQLSTNLTTVKAFINFNSPDHIDLDLFEQIETKEFGFESSYVIGEVCLEELKEKDVLNNRNINVVLMPEESQKNFGGLCVKALKEEIEELKKGQRILEKITV